MPRSAASPNCESAASTATSGCTRTSASGGSKRNARGASGRWLQCTAPCRRCSTSLAARLISGHRPRSACIREAREWPGANAAARG